MANANVKRSHLLQGVPHAAAHDRHSRMYVRVARFHHATARRLLKGIADLYELFVKVEARPITTVHQQAEQQMVWLLRDSWNIFYCRQFLSKGKISVE